MISLYDLYKLSKPWEEATTYSTHAKQLFLNKRNKSCNNKALNSIDESNHIRRNISFGTVVFRNRAKITRVMPYSDSASSRTCMESITSRLWILYTIMPCASNSSYTRSCWQVISAELLQCSKISLDLAAGLRRSPSIHSVTASTRSKYSSFKML